MSKTKSYNQIIFLTTLSVYLGLVLVGASPQVLAQAALTSKFEIKDQIEKKDDLDKKPDDELKKVSEGFDDYLDNLEDFIVNLQKLSRIEKFDASYDTFQLDVKTSTPCDVDGDPVQLTTQTNFNNPNWLRPALLDFSYSLQEYGYLSDCLPSTDFGKHKAQSSTLKTSYDKSLLTISLTVEKDSPQKAKQFCDKFNNVIKLYKLDEDEPIVKVLYQNTTVTAENNQVFIVTRLPRAAIDSLIKQ
jgi:hypothetical protein